LISYGSDGLEGLKKTLADDLVMFGLLRLDLPSPDGVKSKKLVKHVFVHWAGPSAPPVKLGKNSTRWADAKIKMQSHCSLNLTVGASCRNDLQIEQILADLHRLTVIDVEKGTNEYRKASADVVSKTSSAAGRIPAIASKEAKAEDTVELSKGEMPEDGFNDEETDEEQNVDPNLQLPDMQTAISGVREGNAAWSWVLVGSTIGMCEKVSSMNGYA